jgi:hypothetical protein
MTCEVCKYWSRNSKHTGECRRYAPRAATIYDRYRTQATEEYVAIWPQTNTTDECGEGKLKNEKE